MYKSNQDVQLTVLHWVQDAIYLSTKYLISNYKPNYKYNVPWILDWDSWFELLSLLVSAADIVTDRVFEEFFATFSSYLRFET